MHSILVIVLSWEFISGIFVPYLLLVISFALYSVFLVLRQRFYVSRSFLVQVCQTCAESECGQEGSEEATRMTVIGSDITKNQGETYAAEIA